MVVSFGQIGGKLARSLDRIQARIGKCVWKTGFFPGQISYLSLRLLVDVRADDILGRAIALFRESSAQAVVPSLVVLEELRGKAFDALRNSAPLV